MFIIISVIAVIGAFQIIEAQPKFCSSCHEMEFYYESWISSTHADEVECLGCHSEPGVKGFIDTKIRGLTEFIVHITGDYEVPIKPHIRVKNPRCLECHSDAGSIPDVDVDARHDLHMGYDVLCVDCHSRLVHSAFDEPKTIQIDECDYCHNHHGDFSIQSKHVLLKCSDCHPGRVYYTKSNLCQDCHEVPLDHVEGIYSNCEACHSDRDWTLISFNHITIALKGEHSNLRCLDCHQVDSYIGLSPNCESCHILPEPHPIVRDKACVDCHTVGGWYQAEFDHEIFSLTGKHQNVPCIDCHIDDVYDTAPILCEGCHDAPVDHVIEMNSNCGYCHVTTGWTPAEYDHNIFPLTGAHEAFLCTDCHIGGTLIGTPTDCIDCHAEPSNHAGLSRDCTQCHSTSTFSSSTYRHPRIPEHYPRGEKRLDCVDCHRRTYASYTCMGSGCHSTNNPKDD